MALRNIIAGVSGVVTILTYLGITLNAQEIKTETSVFKNPTSTGSAVAKNIGGGSSYSNKDGAAAAMFNIDKGIANAAYANKDGVHKSD